MQYECTLHTRYDGCAVRTLSRCFLTLRIPVPRMAAGILRKKRKIIVPATIPPLSVTTCLSVTIINDTSTWYLVHVVGHKIEAHLVYVRTAPTNLHPTAICSYSHEHWEARQSYPTLQYTQNVIQSYLICHHKTRGQVRTVAL